MVSIDTSQKHRAVTHALHVPVSPTTRVWYDLTVLPPASVSTCESLAIGFSEGTNATSIAEVDENGCALGSEVYFWHRCTLVLDYIMMAANDISNESIRRRCAENETAESL